MVDALLLIDVIARFEHEDGDKLRLAPRAAAGDPRRDRAGAAGRRAGRLRERLDGALGFQRAGDHALGRGRRAGAEIAQLAPEDGDLFVLKPRYSAFDHTPLVLLLRELGVDRIVVAGAATEMCVVQSAIDARELGFKVTVLADACATVDDEMERLSLTYVERVGGAFVHEQSEWEPGR